MSDDETYFSHVNHTMPSSAKTTFYKGLSGYRKQVSESIYPASPTATVGADGTTSDTFSSDNLLLGVGWTYTAGGSAEIGHSVKTISVRDGGSGYTSAPTVTFSGGGGSGASATANINTDGEVASVDVTSEGSGYTTSPNVSFSGGDGSDASAIASLDISLSNASSFKGSRISLRSKKTFTDTTDPRQGEAPYSYYKFDTRGVLYGMFLGGRSVTTKAFGSALDGAFWTSAAAFSGADQNPPINWLGYHQSSLSGNVSWFPSQIKGDLIYNHSAGHRYFYEDGDEVKWYQSERTFSRYGPYDESVFLNHPSSDTGSSVRLVSVTMPGSGYTSAPTVTFSGGGGSGASATAIINADGEVASVTVTSGGSGYTSAPSVSFSGGGGSGASANAQVPFDVATYYVTQEAGIAGALESTFAGGKWPKISLRTSGANAAIAQTYGSSNLSLILDSDLYPSPRDLESLGDPNPETHFSNKRFGTLYSFATGTNVQLTEKKRVFNLGPSLTYTYAAAEPSENTEWTIGADIERDSEKLFEDVKSDKRELGGAVSYHYGSTYSYRKGNSRDVSISGKETAGGLTAYGIEKQSETKVSNGGLIQEKLQRCATEEGGSFVPFKMTTEGGSFQQTNTTAMAKSESWIGIKVEDLATTAKTSTTVSAMSINTKVPPLSIPGLGKVWPSLEASACTGLVGSEVSIYGLKMWVLAKPVAKFLSLFGFGNKNTKLFGLKKGKGHVGLLDTVAKASAMINNARLDIQATKAEKNVAGQLNEINNKAEAALSKINMSVSNTKARATSAKQKTVQTVNLANQASVEASMIGTQILQLKI